jgi:hypothetical protein
MMSTDGKTRMAAFTALAEEIKRLQAKIKKMGDRIAELQDPEGHREEYVAQWLRERGYIVTKS